MLIPEIVNNPSKVQLSKLSHAYFEHPDLNEFSRFAKDFGLIEAKRTKDTIYFRGYGKEQYVYVAMKSRDKKPKFKGACFVALNREEFDKAAKIEGAQVRVLTDAPGGGEMITIPRLGDTYMHIIYGQKGREIDLREATVSTHDCIGPLNTPFEKPRRGKFSIFPCSAAYSFSRFPGQFQRFHEGPALVHKLGHFGYVCVDFDKELDFYTSYFNFVASDVLFHPQLHQVDVLIFMHLDLGQTFVDHHSMFLQRSPPENKKTYLHHSSYEVADFDTQLIGHDWLAKRGWKSVWGVGRHILGSQIFDYWEDSSGFKIEHYADGDVVNCETKARREVAGAISVWGPELPKSFGEDGTAVFSN